MKTSYVFLAPGFEEIEALGTVDALRRGGITVKTVSITDENTVVGAHGIPVVADIKFDEIDDNPDWLILPGGMPGATNLFNCEPLTNLLIEHHKAGGHIAAICASPGVVLGQLGLLNGETATCYPRLRGPVHRRNYERRQKRRFRSIRHRQWSFVDPQSCLRDSQNQPRQANSRRGDARYATIPETANLLFLNITVYPICRKKVDSSKGQPFLHLLRQP